MRVCGQTSKREMKVNEGSPFYLLCPPGAEAQHRCWDPKDGELYLNRVKPEETLVEARSGSDVQIDRRIWV
jgi:hypothetical protein